MENDDIINKYVLGFCVDTTSGLLLLIRKNRPIWQQGRINGLGGKIEPTDLSPVAAMTREFYEEAGVLVPEESWRLFCSLHGKGCVVFCFCAEYEIHDATQKTDEELLWTNLVYLPEKVMDNLHWLVPLAFAQSPIFAFAVEV